MLTVTTLGAPAIHLANGREVRLRTRKQFGVLLVLALDGRDQPVARSLLEEFFWHDVPGERAYHSLCQAISAIRGELGRSAVQRTHDAFRMGIEVRTDIELLDSDDLDAPGLARPLDGIEWCGGPAFGHWLEGARVRVRRMAGQVLLDVMSRSRLAGATLRVHRAADRLYQLDPLSEPAVLALAERELLRGDVVGAIRLLRLHRDRVKEAIGCQPQQAAARLLRRLEAGAHPPVELVPPRLAAHAAQVRPTVLVARERELAFLEGEWQRVARDHTLRTCIVTGPGGIGKSSLARRFAATVAARSHSVVLISCQEIGEGIPFAATSDLVAALLRDPASSETDPIWLAEVSRIHPVIRSQYPGVPHPAETPPETVRLRVADGLTHMLEAVTDGAPVTIIFDDLQYMDPASRDVLHVLARRARDLPLLLIGTARSRGMEYTLPRGPLDDEPLAWSSVLPLEPLTAEGGRTLIATLAPSLQLDAPRVVDRIIGLAEGNPQFTEMLLADWNSHASQSLAAGLAVEQLPRHWEPPDSLRQAFTRFYDGLDTVAQQVLHVLAVAQRALSPEEVADAVNRTPADLDAAALELLSRGILRLEGGRLCFKNELHRAYVYCAVPEDLRKFFHRKLGQLLGGRAKEDDPAGGLEAGHHLIFAEDFEGALQVITATAPSAIECGAPAEAERVIQEYLKQGGRRDAGTMHALLAYSLVAQGRYAEALAAISNALNQMTLSGRNLALMTVLRAHALQRGRLGDDCLIMTEVRRALAEARKSGDDALLTMAAQIATEAASETSDDELLEETVVTVDFLVRQASTSTTRAKALAAKAYSLMSGGDFAPAEEAFFEATEVLQVLGIEHALARCLNGLGICRLAVGRHREALTPFRESIQLAEHLKDVDHQVTVLGNIALTHEELGDFRVAWDSYAAAADLAERTAPRARALAWANAAHMAVVLRDSDAAMRLLASARAGAEETRFWRLIMLVELTEADLALSHDEPEFAWKYVHKAIGLRGGRARTIDNNGKAMRLDLHRQMAIGGPGALSHKSSHVSELTARLRLSDRLEVKGFVAWYLGNVLGDDERAQPLIHEIKESGLPGVLGILRAVGTSPL